MWLTGLVAPIFFTLVVHVLSCMLSRGTERGVVCGLMVADNGIELSYLQFVDDTILFLLDDKENFHNVHSLL